MKKNASEGEDKPLPPPRGEVSEYIYRTKEVLEEHRVSAAKPKVSLPVPKQHRLPRILLYVVSGALLVAVIYFVLKR